jgi:DNA-binding CsgD family transcriptional regulator
MALPAVSCETQLAAIAHGRGDVDTALARSDAALDFMATHRQAWLAGSPVSMAVHCRLARGEVAQAGHLLRDHELATPEAARGRFGALVSVAAILDVRLAEHDLPAARPAFEALLSVQRAGYGPRMLARQAVLPRAALALGDTDLAHELAVDEEDRARRLGPPSRWGSARSVLGLVEGGDDGLGMMREGLAALACTERRLERARCLVELGGALRRAGKRTEAKGVLEDAMDLAARCGASGTAAQAREELLATGARPRRLRVSGVASLTPSERRVADLAARGRTNSEIAQILFVSRKTVETHLAAIYSKLGVHSRGEVATQLAESASPRAGDDA